MNQRKMMTQLLAKIIVFLISVCKIGKMSTFDMDTDSNTNNNQINKLKDLFNITVYRLNVNISSPCTYNGSERLLKCHEVYVYNEKAYLKYISELRAMFLSKLNIKNEGDGNMSKERINQIKFIREKKDQSSSSNIRSRNNDKSNKDNSVKTTRFDKKEMENKILNLINNIDGTVENKYLKNYKKILNYIFCL